MFSPLDIFKTDSDGGVLWRGAAEDFVSAKKCIEKLALSAPGEYLILNQRTGKTQRVKVAFPDNAALSSLDGGSQYIEMSLTSLII
jgi:hypothetical protein